MRCKPVGAHHYADARESGCDETLCVIRRQRAAYVDGGDVVSLPETPVWMARQTRESEAGMVRQIVWSPRSTVCRQIRWRRADQSPMSREFLRDKLVILEVPQPDRDVESLRNQIDIAIGIFDLYRNTRIHFADELRECRSRGQFDGLIEDLEFFRDELGVDVDSLLEDVEVMKAEYEDHENASADHRQDEWKERGAMNATVSEAFPI